MSLRMPLSLARERLFASALQYSTSWNCQHRLGVRASKSRYLTDPFGVVERRMVSTGSLIFFAARHLPADLRVLCVTLGHVVHRRAAGDRLRVLCSRGEARERALAGGSAAGVCRGCTQCLVDLCVFINIDHALHVSRGHAYGGCGANKKSRPALTVSS